MEVSKSHSYLGATPIIITDQVQAVVEVKCLFTGRKDKIQPGQNFKFRREENHKIVLDVGHQYYDQVKGQMYISGNAKCFFVVSLLLIFSFKKYLWTKITVRVHL